MSSPFDSRNSATGAFTEPKFQTIITDAASFEAIAKGQWNRSPENAGLNDAFKTSFRRYGASKLFIIMMQHELQVRLNANPALSNICVVGIDPGTMVSGMTRRAPWVIRVLMFQIIYAIILWLNPSTSMVSSPKRSAADVLEAAFGAENEDLPPKDKYYVGREPFETSKESEDPTKRELVWTETAKMVGLKADDTPLTKWD
jgi:NAD(P)-dependent dehydrogenase (short-subunit alcohol dehydrogenase family)